MTCLHYATRAELHADQSLRARICNTCGAPLGLGPARDTPEAVIELRAAELADLSRIGMEAQFVAAMTAVERGGWNIRAHDFPWVPISGEACAGYLAHCIVTHTSMETS